MSKEKNALTFVTTVMIEGGSGLGYSIPAGALIQRTRWSRGQKALAKGLGGMVLGTINALWAPRLGAGMAISGVNTLGDALVEKTRLNEKIDKLITGTGTTNSSGAVRGGARRRRTTI